MYSGGIIYERAGFGFNSKRTAGIINRHRTSHEGHWQTISASDKDYKIALRKEILRLRVEDGVAWTACYDLALGDEEVAELRFKRDIRQSDYDVCIEKINSLKLEIRLLEGEIKQEWGA